MFSKLHITERDSSNVLGISLLKLLSIVDIFLRKLLRYNYFNEDFRMAACAAFYDIIIKSFDLKLLF